MWNLQFSNCFEIYSVRSILSYLILKARITVQHGISLISTFIDTKHNFRGIVSKRINNFF